MRNCLSQVTPQSVLIGTLPGGGGDGGPTSVWSLQARVLSGAQAGPSSYRTGAPCFFVQGASNEMRSSFRRRGGGYALPFTPEERLAEGGARSLSASVCSPATRRRHGTSLEVSGTTTYSAWPRARHIVGPQETSAAAADVVLSTARDSGTKAVTWPR